MEIPYLPSVEWYKKYVVAVCQNRQMTATPFISDRRHLNRCQIVTAGGIQTLSVPIEGGGKALRNTPFHLISLSDHGNWRHVHWNALFSAYGKAPFFEHYAHLFEPIYRQPLKTLADLNSSLHNAAVKALALDNILPYIVENFPMEMLSDEETAKETTYYQLRADRFGFVAGMSIVDLIFNEGPQAILTLLPSVAHPR